MKNIPRNPTETTKDARIRSGVARMGLEKECACKNEILYIAEDNKELIGGFDGK